MMAMCVWAAALFAKAEGHKSDNYTQHTEVLFLKYQPYTQVLYRHFYILLVVVVLIRCKAIEYVKFFCF